MDASWHRNRVNMNSLIVRNTESSEKSFNSIARRPRRPEQATPIVLRIRPPRDNKGSRRARRESKPQPQPLAAHQNNDLIVTQLATIVDSGSAAEYRGVHSRGASTMEHDETRSRRRRRQPTGCRCRRPVLILASLVISCMIVNRSSSIYCLQSEINVAANGATNLVNQQQLQQAMNSLPVEARAATDLPTRAQANAFDLMANYLLANLANSQPLAAAAAAANQAPSNSFINNQRRIQLNQQQQPQLSPSTPANPFLIPNFQPTRRQVMQLNPNNLNNLNNPNNPNNLNNLNNNNNNLFLVASSSPPTPHLTLNRLASLANQQNRNNQPFSVNGGHSMPNNNNNNLNGGRQQANGNRPANMQPRGQQPPPQQQPLGFRPVQVPAIPMAANPSQPKPMSGFAPSGPPPSALNSNNNAMVLVQSPANAIGVQLAPSESPGPPPQPPPTTITMATPASTTQTTAAAAAAAGANRGNSDEPVRSRPPSGQQQAADEAAATTTTTTVSVSSAPSVSSGGSPATDSQAEFERERDRQTTNPSLIAASNNRSTGAVAAAEPTGPPTTQAAPANADSGSQPAAAAATEWNPVQNRSEAGGGGAAELAAARRRTSSLAPSPDIVTVPPDYNPDTANSQPQSYDISVSAQMGGPAAAKNATTSQGGAGAGTDLLRASPSATLAAPIATVSAGGESDLQPATVAPTAVTTIFWSPSASDPSSSSSSSSSGSSSIQPSRVLATDLARPSSAMPNRIRDSSAASNTDDGAGGGQAEPSQQETPAAAAAAAAGVVYGKPQARDSKPAAPAGQQLVSPSPVAHRAASIESSVAGRPFIQPVQIDNQVRPYAAASQQQPTHPSIVKSNHGQQQQQHHSAAPFRPSKPLNAPISVGSGFTIVANGNQTMPSGDIQDYVANQGPLLVPSGGGGGGSEPTISAQGGPDPQLQQQQPPPHESASNQTAAPAVAQQQAQPAHRIRRPTFRPKPREPIQIDSCLPGDASSCDQAHNEHCHREFGISSCHCRPGYARLSQLRGYCSPISLFQLNLKIDRLSDERPLVFNSSLQDSNNVEYQYLEFETIQAIAGAIQQTALAKQFMGAKVNKFFERKGKVWANISINLETPPAGAAAATSATTAANGGQQQLAKSGQQLQLQQQQERLQSLANQELARLAQLSKPGKPLGDSTIMLDGSRESVSKLHDVDECASRELNDCARNGSLCTNELGGFQCQCLPGYQDMHSNEDRSRQGRACLGCPASYCSNRGECLIQADGQKQCHCRANFYGARCDIDSEVLIVAMAGALVGVVILVITCWCFFMFNRRWKREQQKMDAMSATSGLTFNYVNSTMGGGGGGGGLHRSGGHQVAASYMGQRFGVGGGVGVATLIGGGVGGHHKGASAGYDQQAIIGSTSSGSSASSSQAPLGCNPYAPALAAGGHYAPVSHYDDAGLLIAPASAGSSEQTSPSANSYRGIIQQGNSYTLSGHHHAHHHHHAHPHAHHQQLIQHQHQQNHTHHRAPITQFNPAAAAADYCQDAAASNRWRTMQPGYYLSPDMLMGGASGHAHHHHQLHQHQHQQLYASPQRELCIDTGQSRKQRGRRAS